MNDPRVQLPRAAFELAIIGAVRSVVCCVLHLPAESGDLSNKAQTPASTKLTDADQIRNIVQCTGSDQRPNESCNR